MNDERTWNAITVAAGAVIVGLIGYHLSVPMPRARGADKYLKDETQLALDQRVAVQKAEKQEAANTIRLWNLGAEALGPMAMARVSNMAKAHNLNMVSFRPQRGATAEDLVRSGFTIALEGSFPQVIQFARKLETPATKLAVVSLQVTSTDGASDQVTATIGVVAYRDQDAGAKPVTSAATETKSTLASENQSRN